MVAHRHLSAVSATHLLALGLILGCALTGVAPIAFADTPPGTSTDQATVSEPTTDVTPAPDPAPLQDASAPAPSRSAPVSKSPASGHTRTTPAASSGSATRIEPARTAVPTHTVVQPSVVPIVAPQSRSAGATVRATVRHPTAKTAMPKAPAKHRAAPSTALERPPATPALEHSAPSVVVSHLAPPHTSDNGSRARPNTVARNLVVVLDAVAILLLAIAWIPRGVLHRRAFTHRTLRFRPTLAAAGISLFSASLILFMLNLSGPVP
jgi:hypothetical protein